MANYRNILCLIALIIFLKGSSHAANFSGPGIFMSSNACSDVTSPVTGKTICWDTVNKRWNVWNGTAFQGIQGSWLLGDSSSLMTGNSTTYMSMQGAGTTTVETTNMPSIAPIPGRVCNLACAVVTAPAAGKTWTFVFQASNLPAPLTASSLTCTISSTSNGACADVAQTDCATMTAGEAFDVKVTGTGTPASTYGFCSATVN